MLQYIINLSGIWLVSLVIFDLLLKRETFHTYNRLFLNASVSLGILLPLWQLQQSSIIYASAISKDVTQQAAVLREQVINTTSPALVSIETWLWIIYVIGASVMTIVLLKEVYLILKLLRSGIKTQIGQWKVVEINKETAPFSAFGYVFISSKENYTTNELNLILIHEQQHINSWHIIDLLFINFLKIAFWFNPLIYLYEKRLLMIHEYQADKAVDHDIKKYSQFLVEQSMLQTAPILSHSFIRSPLKSRIKMLTKQSKRIANLKQLIIAPLVLFTLLCFTQNNLLFAQEKKVEGNKIYYKGNTIELTEKMPDDTVYVSDPVTGEIQMVITSLTPSPAKLNGVDLYKKYYRSSNLPPLFEETTEHIKTEIKKNLNDALNTMEEGSFRYAIENLIVDQKGKIIYYELAKTGSAFRLANGGEDYDLTEDARKNIEQKIVNTLEDIKLDVFLQDGKPVPYIIFVDDYFNIVK
ncbi:MAG: M56 family metallopeptidase [Flavipsychrobacter sp.]